MIISLIVAMDNNYLISRKDGRLPWKVSADLKRFRKITMGHAVIMGRKTFLSMGRILPGRQNIIITTDRSLCIPEACMAKSLEQAVDIAFVYRNDEAFVIGGAETFARAISFVNRIYFTVIDSCIEREEGDIFFPMSVVDMSDWEKISDEYLSPSKDTGGFRLTFSKYERRSL